MSSTKNIGQVVGLFIGTNPPSNTKLIWYDSTPNQNCHKVYDVATKLWRALNPEIIAVTTYSELVINAGKNGLSIGKQYQIRDKNNLLATAITSTKIQYFDELGNVVIDDLGSSPDSDNKQYIVTSNNIYIDDINGVLNDSNQLIFSFTDGTPNYDNDYVLGKSRSGTKWILSKFSIKKFLSNVAGNSLTWNNGLFFNFANAIKGILDKTGGIVSWNTYTKQVQSFNTAIGNVSKENQNIISNTEESIALEVTDDKIFEKKLPINIDITVAAGDIQRLDKLKDIIQKIQRWINQFKYATGIKLSRNFAEATSYQYVNNNDTVESAFSKIQYILKNPTHGFSLPSNWNKDTDVIPVDKPLPEPGDTFYWAFLKLRRYLENIFSLAKLPSDWVPISYTANFKTPDKGDDLSTVIAKLTGKFNQIGIIYNGVIESRERNDDSTSAAEGTGTPKLKIDFNEGIITSRKQTVEGVSLSPEAYAKFSASEGLVFGEGIDDRLVISNNRFDYYGKSWNYYNDLPYKIVNAQGYKMPIGVAIFNQHATAFSAKNLGSYTYNYYDAFFSNIKLGGINYDAIITETDYYITETTSMVICQSKSESINVYLPANPETGRTIFIARSTNAGVNVYSQGGNGIDKIGSSSTNVAIGSRGQVYMFTFVRDIFYESESSGRIGLWQFAILTH